MPDEVSTSSFHCKTFKISLIKFIFIFKSFLVLFYINLFFLSNKLHIFVNS
jgi:hypothetical protein